MCLMPQTIVTPKSVLRRNGGESVLLNVPCGHCAECSEAKKKEYFLRSFYEAKQCFDVGGFVLFDTLTYCDNHLPHISDYVPLFKDSLFDYPCFSRRDIRLFLVLLRENLSRKGYDIKDKLKYFITSEYGSDPFHTHRPHYHVLFYSTVPQLDPLVLSEEISTAWPHGRTDGFPYQSEFYVRSKRVYMGDLFAAENAARYVSKYVNKSSSFSKIIDSRVEALYFRLVERKHDLTMFNPNMEEIDKSEIFNLVQLTDVDGKKWLRNYLRRCCCEFHRQSNGFGLYALKYNTIDDVFETGCLTVHTSEDIVTSIPLPTYFKRKLFYELTEDIRGDKQWTLTDLGKQFKLSKVEKNVKMLAERFKDWHCNLELTHGSDSPDVRRAVDLLDGRSWESFAIYIALFKGCLKSSDSAIKSVDTWILRKYWHDLTCLDSGRLFWNYTRENMAVDEKGFTNRDLGTWRHGYKEFKMNETTDFPFDWCVRDVDGKKVYQSWTGFKITKSLPYEFEKLDDFLRRRVVNQDSLPEFHGFDDLYDLYCRTSYYINIKKQNAYDKKENLKQKRKDLKNLCLI